MNLDTKQFCWIRYHPVCTARAGGPRYRKQATTEDKKHREAVKRLTRLHKKVEIRLVA